MSHPIASAVSTSVADAARTAIDEAHCVRIALKECLLSNDNITFKTKIETEAEKEKEEKGVEHVIEVIGTSNDVKVLKDGVEIQVQVMDVVTSDPMDELFIDQPSDSVITAPTHVGLKSTNDSDIVVMDVEDRKEAFNAGLAEGKEQGIDSGEGRVEVANKEIVTIEGKGTAEKETVKEAEKETEVVKAVIKEKVKDEDEEDREYFQHLDATVHKDLCLVYLVSQQVPPSLSWYHPLYCCHSYSYTYYDPLSCSYFYFYHYFCFYSLFYPTLTTT